MNEPDQTALLVAAMPFAALLGLQDVHATPDRVQASIAWDPTRCTAGGILHGGLLMAVDPTGLEALIADLHARGVPVAAHIGDFTDRAGYIEVI